jgi:hypothetical protein
MEQYRRINPKLARYVEFQVKTAAFKEVIQDIQNESGVFSPESDGTDLNVEVVESVKCMERELERQQLHTDQTYRQIFSFLSRSEALENSLFEKVQTSCSDSQRAKRDENSKLAAIEKKLNTISKKKGEKLVHQRYATTDFKAESSKFYWFAMIISKGLRHQFKFMESQA